jgi:predicted patatin/cPLA2 family phospholipase
MDLKTGLKARLLDKISFFRFIERVLNASTNSNTIVAKLLFKETNLLRISDSFPEKAYATNMFEADPKKLLAMFQLGKWSYAKYEKEINDLLELND